MHHSLVFVKATQLPVSFTGAEGISGGSSEDIDNKECVNN